ncbi:MAG: hypothetical protein JO307_08010 [Bryobacterales bacterium]|nr:hypothetical protein [Bryobacterales bacterium]MBV9396505.1 hypothetical protein [Bryobacterales bacterium]
MTRVRVFHWKAQEAEALISEIKAAGYRVDYEEDFGSYWRERKSQPDIFVIDLTRRPSHGREVAIALRGYKLSRGVPIVFVDGDPEKVEGIRKILSDAVYTSRGKLAASLRRAKPVSNPIVPAQMMERYAGRTAAQKLGIGYEARVGIMDPPADYDRVIGVLPEGASFEEGGAEGCKITLWFVQDYAAFEAALPKMRFMAARSRLWILWRKGKRDGLDGNMIRRAAAEFGLVDYKICSPNETWTGMAFAVKKAKGARGI